VALGQKMWRPLVYLHKKKNYIDLACDDSLKKSRATSGNPTNFLISLHDEYPALAKKALRMVLRFSTSYLCETGFSAMMKTKYRSRINLES